MKYVKSAALLLSLSASAVAFATDSSSSTPATNPGGMPAPLGTAGNAVNPPVSKLPRATAARPDTNMGAETRIGNGSVTDTNGSATSGGNVNNSNTAAVPSTATTPNTAMGTGNLSSPQSIMDAQRALSRSGFNVQPDGITGPRTQSAIRQFQQRNGLNETGTLDPATMDALNRTSLDNNGSKASETPTTF